MKIRRAIFAGLSMGFAVFFFWQRIATGIPHLPALAFMLFFAVMARLEDLD